MFQCDDDDDYDINNNKCNNKNNNNHNNNSNNNDDNDDDKLLNDITHMFEYIGYKLNFYLIPLIVCAGTLGNTLSVIVFLKTKLHKLSSTYYLTALAISDNCFLFSSFIQWLNFWDIRLYHRDHFCQFFTFITNLASFCSSWFVVAFTVERFIAVMYPLKRQFVCTVSRAKLVLLCIIILGILHCSPLWLFSMPAYSDNVRRMICDIREEYKYYATLHNYWDTLIVYTAPFSLIIVLNSFTGYTVWKFATVRCNLIKSKKKAQQLETNLSISAASKPNNSSDDMKWRSFNMATTTTTTTTTITSSPLSSPSSIKTITKLHNRHQQYQQQQQQQFFFPINFKRNKKKYCNKQKLNFQKCATIMLSPVSSTIRKSTNNNQMDAIRKSAKACRKLPATNSSQLKVTKMLLLVSTVFVCLNLPSCVLRIKAFIEVQSKSPSSSSEKTTMILQYIFYLLLVTNFGINFILYCISGQNFRKALLNMFGKRMKAQMEPIPQLTVSENFRTVIGTGGIDGTCTGSKGGGDENENDINGRYVTTTSSTGFNGNIIDCSNSIKSINYLLQCHK